MDDVIQKCFQIHCDLFGGNIKFSFEQYKDFWVNHHVGDSYILKHRNGKSDVCKVAYYPLPDYSDLRALIEIQNGDSIDFREVPVHFLQKITVTI